MSRALITAVVLVVTSIAFGATVLREQVASAAQAVLPVLVTNDASHPVPVHEQGIANVSITNPSLSIAPAAPITGGGGERNLGPGTVSVGTTIATALSIKMTSGVVVVGLFTEGNPISIAAEFYGPAGNGNGSVVLALTRPIKFDSIGCSAESSSDLCSVSWVGAQP